MVRGGRGLKGFFFFFFFFNLRWEGGEITELIRRELIGYGQNKWRLKSAFFIL